MEKAKDVFKIGQSVEILVHNSHQGEIGKIVAFDEHNEYNVKVQIYDNFVQGYMVSELRPIPRVGAKLPLNKKLHSIIRKLWGYLRK